MPNWMCSIVVLLVVGAPSRAQAVPADFLILIDSSGSMSKTQGSETRLDAAKTLATSLIKALRTKHRVGLARFAQLEQVVTGGEGKRVVYAEDEKQCEHASNLLAPVEPAGADQALRWLDGVEALGNPELVAVGDSPLVRAVTVAVEYLRGKRKGDPLRHCVNAYLIVITDGEDTCAGGDELRWQLSQLAAAAQKEDIHALVLSYTPDAAAAKAVAAIGQSAGVKPFGSGDSAKLLAAVQAIQGHLAPEACIASGVKPAQIGLGPDTTGGDGVKPCAAQGDDGGCGCVVAARPGPDGVAALLLLLGLALLAPLGRATVRSRRRRRLLLVLVALAALAVLALAGCGDDGVAVCPHVRPPARSPIQRWSRAPRSRASRCCWPAPGTYRTTCSRRCSSRTGRSPRSRTRRPAPRWSAPSASSPTRTRSAARPAVWPPGAATAWTRRCCCRPASRARG